jgi:hypothetical protein
MIHRIATILKDRIAAFTYVDKIGGLTRVARQQREGKEIVIPVAGDVDEAYACDPATIRDMVPDDRYGCMVYFEDRGTTRESTRTRGTFYSASLRLVCWVNTAKFGSDPNAADRIIEQFVNDLNVGQPYNTDTLIGLNHQVDGFPQRGASIFSQYTYPEAARQYLLWPFDAFAVDITATYRIKPGCEEAPVPDDDACWTPPVTKKRRNPSEFTCDELTDPVTGLTTEQLGPECLDCDGGECDPLSVRVNGEPYATIEDPCGGIASVEVVQGDVPVGELIGGQWVVPECPPCDDLSYTLVNTDDTELESGVVVDPCGASLDLVAPDADVTFDGLPVLTVPSGATGNLDCGTLLDAAYVQDGGSVTGTYLVTGTLNGREIYTLDGSHNLEYTGTRWRLVKPGSDVDAALGSETFPWLADWSATSVTVQQATIGAYCGGNEVPCADLTVTINGTTYGTVADPCGATAPVDVHDSNGNDVGSLVSGAWVVAAPANVLREYTASDTWNKPADASFVGAFVVCVGAGGGGECGDLRAGTTVQATGGSGGGGGWVVWDFIAAASLGGTEAVTVPTGGAGAPGRNTAGDGIAGTLGGDASFGTHVVALGGAVGIGAETGRDIAGCTPRKGSNIMLGHPAMRAGNVGGCAGYYWPTTGVPQFTTNNSRAPGGAPGGNAGSRQVGGNTTAARAGGDVWNGTALTGGGALGATGAGNGGDGTGNIVLTLLSSYGVATTNGAGGGGGGGGAGTAIANAGNGGNGTISAGGGGGGGGTVGVGDGISGDGGNGGAGIVYVYEIYKI